MSSTTSSPVERTFPSAISSPSTLSTYSAKTSSYFSTSSSTTRSLASTTNAELVVAEVHYLSTLKRVGNALNLTSNQSLAQGRKTSNTVRALVERWTSMIHLHIKFHDDIVAAKEDVRSAIKLLNGLLVTLEPLLADHSRDLSNTVYKLGRNDKRSGHKPSDWDVSLRNPFDHLNIYNEWLQRVDPQGKYNGECLAQLNSLVVNIKSIVEANQNPRGMLKRISTLARNVIKRPSSAQLLGSNGSSGLLGQSQELSPTSPAMTMTSPIINTAITVTTEYTYINSTCVNLNSRGSLDLTRASSASENMIETVTDQISALAVSEQATGNASALTSPGEDTPSPNSPNNCYPNRSSVARSDVSSVGSLTLAASSESLHSKSLSSGNRPNSGRQLSAASQRQLFMEERDSRKATLRVGTNSFIAAKAASLQNQSLHYKKSSDLERLKSMQSNTNLNSERKRSGGFVSRPSIDRLRTITSREAETKPPVKTLISFWEQAIPIEV